MGRTGIDLGGQSVPALHVHRQPVPNAAQAGDKLTSAADRSNGKTRRNGKRPQNAAKNAAHAARLTLIEPEIDAIAGIVITTDRRALVELQPYRAQPPDGGGDAGIATHVLMEHAAVDN